MIKTICKSCGNNRSFEDSFLGKKFKCPTCGNPVSIVQKDEYNSENIGLANDISKTIAAQPISTSQPQHTQNEVQNKPEHIPQQHKGQIVSVFEKVQPIENQKIIVHEQTQLKDESLKSFGTISSQTFDLGQGFNKNKKFVIVGSIGLFALVILIVALKFAFSPNINKDEVSPSIVPVTTSSPVTQPVQQIESPSNNSNQQAPQVENNSKIEQYQPGFYITNGSRIYFHNTPDIKTRRKAYLITQENVYVQKVQNGFGYIEFTNTNGQTTYGWIEMQYLILEPN